MQFFMYGFWASIRYVTGIKLFMCDEYVYGTSVCDVDVKLSELRKGQLEP